MSHMQILSICYQHPRITTGAMAWQSLTSLQGTGRRKFRSLIRRLVLKGKVSGQITFIVCREYHEVSSDSTGKVGGHAVTAFTAKSRRRR